MAHILSVIVDYFLSKTMKSASSNLILYTAKVAVNGCRIKVIHTRTVNMVLFVGIFHPRLMNHRKSDTSNLNTTSILHKGPC